MTPAFVGDTVLYMRALLLSVLLVSTACSSADDGPCSTRTGSYLQRYETRSGDCGPLTETVVHLDDGATSMGADCTGGNSVSADQCSIRSDYECQVPGSPQGVRAAFKGHITWTREGGSGSGLLELFVTDNGASVCRGTYDVTIVKL